MHFFFHHVLKPWELEGLFGSLVLSWFSSGPSGFSLSAFSFPLRQVTRANVFHHVLKPWKLEGLSGSLVLSWVSSGPSGSSLVAFCGCPLAVPFLFL